MNKAATGTALAAPGLRHSEDGCHTAMHTLLVGC